VAEIKSATDLIVYQKAYALAMEIFRLCDKGQHIVNMNQCHHIVNTAS
jgi:hypothetical protein